MMQAQKCGCWFYNDVICKEYLIDFEWEILFVQNAKIKLPLPFAVWVQIVYTGILDGYVACCAIVIDVDSNHHPRWQPTGCMCN